MISHFQNLSNENINIFKLKIMIFFQTDNQQIGHKNKTIKIY